MGRDEKINLVVEDIFDRDYILTHNVSAKSPENRANCSSIL